MRRNRPIAVAAILALFAGAADAALMTGDIAIIGVHTDGNSNDADGSGDAFAWVTLVDLPAGEVIHFSDAGYYETPAEFGDTEGLLTYTVPAGGHAAGTVVTASNADPGTADLSLAGLPAAGTGYTTGASAYSAGGHVNLSGSGDQLVAFQDDDLSDVAGFTALFAANTASNTWSPDPISDFDSNQTNLYPGLVDGATAVALGVGDGNQDEIDNARYVGPTIGTRAELLAAIADSGNWEGTQDGQPALTRDWATNGVSQFTIIPEPTTAALATLAASGTIGAWRRR